MSHPDKIAPGTEINAVLSSITGALVGHFEMSKILDQVVSTSMATLHAEVCSIYLLERYQDRSILIMRAGSGFARPLVGHARYELGEGFSGYIAKNKQGFNIRSREQLETLEIDGRRIWQGKHDQLQWPSKQSQFRNCIALPLMIKQECLGVIKVENKELGLGSFFNDDEYRYFEIIANVVALAIENARLHEKTENQLKAIAGKAAHRIHNQTINYDGIELALEAECLAPAPDRAQLRVMLTRLQETTKNLKRMTEEFKTYGKPLRLERRPVDVNKIIEDEIWLAAQEIAKRTPPAGVTIVPTLQKDLPHLELDAARFAEAIKELLRNAVKAISSISVGGRPRGTIQVATLRQRIVDTSDPERPETTASECVFIAISDDGPGFPPGFPVFEPFHSTDTTSTGLGLATVKELIEAHGGRIRVGPGSSARIEMELPLLPGR